MSKIFGREFHGQNDKSQILVIKIYEELSEKQMSESQQILSLQNRKVESQNGQLVKDFVLK